ncbi:MAG TPA: hypothetical protein VKB47_08925 [Terracidiphilus sp.]|nr:hypothetical protein [Terracidiphilus sp.]
MPRIDEMIKWYDDVILRLVGRKLKRIADLKEEASWSGPLSPIEKQRLNDHLAKLQREIDAERNWQPPVSVLDELRALEAEAASYGRAMAGANLGLLQDIVSQPKFAVTWRPEKDEAWEARSNKAHEKYRALCEKWKVPVNGMADLMRWGMVDTSTGYYHGRVKAGLAVVK